jgi:hypothetical protein
VKVIFEDWQPLPALASVSNRLTRSVALEAQYIANAGAWRATGGPPWVRLFNRATVALERGTTSDRFLFWVDCFSAHEPWVDADDLMGPPPHAVILPPYGTTSLFSPLQIADLRARYAARIQRIDEAMLAFTESVEHLVCGGDVALVVLSDHGFLFGEYGLVGKPKQCPVLQPLHDIVAWFSAHFSTTVSPDDHIQPSDVGTLVAQLLGFEFKATARRLPRPQVIGRNAPEVAHLVVADDSGMAVLRRNGETGPALWMPWDTHQTSRPWEVQAEPLYRHVACSTWRGQAAALLRSHPWGCMFLESLNAVEDWA